MPGDLTPLRLLRIAYEHWLLVFFSTAVGVGIGYLLSRTLPATYEAHAEFVLNVKTSTYNGGVRSVENVQEYVEHFNTRLYQWCSEVVMGEALRNYQLQHPASKFTTEEVAEALSSTNIELVPYSHLLKLSVSGGDPVLVADLANGYVEAIEARALRDSGENAVKSIDGLVQIVTAQKAKVSKLRTDLACAHQLGKIEDVRTDLATKEKSYADLLARLRETELEDRSLFEWVKMLREVKRNPENFGTLSSKAPRAAEINAEYVAFQKARNRYDALCGTYTEQHPEVKNAARELDAARLRFRDATRRALATGAAMLRDNHTRLLDYRMRKTDEESALGELRQALVSAEDGIRRIEMDLSAANRLLEQQTLALEHARAEAAFKTDSVSPGLKATPPKDPIFPDPVVFMLTAGIIALFAGMAFAVLKFNRDDRISSVEGLRRSVGIEPVGGFPLESGRQRRDLARSPEFDSHSAFAEAAAGLRNRLDSPLFDSVSRRVLVLSTQPGEGKTSTATSLAICSAQVGRRTLLVDFDLRRPQQARIWNIPLTRERSLSHVLQDSVHGPVPDFATLTNATSVPGLDVVASLPPDGIHPASIFGSRALRDFFVWARVRYDRIVIDAPPWGIVGDTVKLAAMADGVLIMCRLGVTSASQMVSCIMQLTDSGSRVLGAVVNGLARGEAPKFVPGRHHRENATGIDRNELVEQTSCFADEE